MNRRRLINLFLGGSIIGTVGSFLYPLIRFLTPPPQSEAAAKRILAAKVGELAPNAAKIFKFGSTPAILINTADGELRAFTAVCTHLTCTIRYEADNETLYCPCHNGRFDLSGNVLSGPPPKPLESYEVEISGGDVYVSRKA
ncbi:MAG: Rieske 2Fe-2S domain-containing protein [Acidobacteriota bacterium]